MTVIRALKSDDDQPHVRQLFWEYLEWANGRVNEEFGVDFDITSMLENDMDGLEKFLPPTGRLLLACRHGQFAAYLERRTPWDS